MNSDWNQWSYLNMTRGWQLAGEQDIATGLVTCWLHNLTVPDHLTVHDIMIRRGGRARMPLADWAGRGWRMSYIELTEAEAAAIRDGTDPLTLLAGPRIRLEIVRTDRA